MKHILLAAAFLLTAVLNAGGTWDAEKAYEQANDLDRALLKIRHEHTGKDTPQNDLAAKALKLLGTNSSPEDKGKIYSTVAAIYSENGWTGQDAADESAKYCELALKYPLDPETAARLYHHWGSDLDMGNRDNHIKGADFIALRRKISDLYLRGLKLVLANLTATQYEYPGVGKIDCPSTSPSCQKIIKEHYAQMKESFRSRYQNKLLDRRKELTQSIVDLYARMPYDQNEFKKRLDASISDKSIKTEMQEDLAKIIDTREKFLRTAASSPNQPRSKAKPPIKKKMRRAPPQTQQQ
ncbi:MAG: hypothetical protein HKL90_11110 [Elusimicrobia bacterium]|nr:hypothetical protein [Elusimicrobiota bacterium]